MLIDEKNTTLSEFHEMEPEFDAIAQLPINHGSYVNQVDFS
jgi:hypothetical protein